MLLAYCGAGYQDRQTNPGAITVDGSVEQTSFYASAIAQCNFGDFRKVGWMRAARIEQGVSAVGPIVSARLVIDPPREPAASDGTSRVCGPYDEHGSSHCVPGTVMDVTLKRDNEVTTAMAPELALSLWNAFTQHIARNLATGMRR